MIIRAVFDWVFSCLFIFLLLLIGLTKSEQIIASCHPSDQLSLDAFKVIKDINQQTSFSNIF